MVRKPALLDADLFRAKPFRLGVTQQIALGGTMIALPIYPARSSVGGSRS